MASVTPFLQPTYIISVLIALSFHEAAHAFIAHRLGDPTAKHQGRLTLNPIAHIDPLGALLFLLAGFGWAKPVPVNPYYFQHPKRDTALVALAGPVSNLILAIIAFALLLLIGGGPSSMFDLLNATGGSPVLRIISQILGASVFVNLALMAFNLLPIAPLDGSKILQMFIPVHFEDRYEEFMRVGPYILLGLIIFERVLPIAIISTWVQGIIGFVLNVLLAVAGIF